MLKQITLEGFKSFRNASIDVRKGLNVLIGANGAGKSNLVEAFSLLGELVQERLQLAVAQRGGASALLHKGPGASKRIRLTVRFDSFSYSATLASAADDDLFFEEEVVSYQNPTAAYFERRFGQGHRESRLSDPGEQPGAMEALSLRTVSSWKTHHFHDTSASAAVKQKGPVGDDRALRPDASNLAAFLYRLQRSHRREYERIQHAVRTVAPFFESFDLHPDRVNDQVIQLEWRQRGTRRVFQRPRAVRRHAAVHLSGVAAAAARSASAGAHRRTRTRAASVRDPPAGRDAAARRPAGDPVDPVGHAARSTRAR